ncbi:MAG: Mur ligase domain-containing protein [Chitinophagales bacterium]|nr:Mur ligase domain-containing protein [Chitinophagales bacterium]
MKMQFIAIGGAIMHNLALCLKELGHEVNGSDDIIFDPAKSNLEKAGILPKRIGFFEDNITPDIDVVILGMHAKKDNIELKKSARTWFKNSFVS